MEANSDVMHSPCSMKSLPVSTSTKLSHTNCFSRRATLVLLYCYANLHANNLCLDSFLRARDKADHEATAMMKAQFMSLWDGKIF